jgi:hypothetical protein
MQEMNDRPSAPIVCFSHPRYSFALNGRIPRAADVDPGRPHKLWLALRIRGNMPSGSPGGSLVAFSRRECHTGPLAHSAELKRREY